MRLIRRYILNELLAPFVICLITLTFVVFARELSRLTELLIARSADLQTVLKISLSLLPAVLIFTLPMSFLVGTIVGFSRLSSDGEITALRASGIGLFDLLKPTLIFASGVWIMTGLVTLALLPLGNDVLRRLTYEVSLNQIVTEFRPRVFNEDLPNLVVYIHNLPSNRSQWENIFVAETASEKEQRVILAEKGRLLTDPGTRKLQLHLENGTVYKVNLDEVDKDNLSRFKATELAILLSDSSLQKIRPRKLEEMSTIELIRDLNRNHVAKNEELLIELNTRFALPVAALIFAVLGLSLGTTRKAGKAFGLILGILLVMLYYNLFLSGKRLAGLGKISPTLGIWQANILFLISGLLLFVKSAREISFGGLNRIRILRKVTIGMARLWERVGLFFSRLDVRKEVRVSLPMIRIQLMRIIGLYIMRGFTGFFLLSLATCLSIFIVFTFFSLINDVIRNQIPLGLVAEYFVYLLPQMLMLLIPIAILLATLINFGILEKSNQVTAFKASGVSLYRLAVPIFFVSVFISSLMYLIQEYVLPYANQRQDSIRHIIKGRPAQTAYRPEKKWVFGEESRLYNYAYFDPKENLFAGFSVFTVDLTRQLFISRIYASKASWNSTNGWILENGWVRTFQSEQPGFRKFDKERFDLPEQASYFKQGLLEPKETSKMTYGELSQYILHLLKGGFDVTGLQLELYKKISLPFSTLIMALIAVPFSFSVGKRGAFHGIAIAIVIGIVYWGTMNLFEALGSYGLLAPVLAAWAANVLYGAVGVYLLFTIKT